MFAKYVMPSAATIIDFAIILDEFVSHVLRGFIQLIIVCPDIVSLNLNCPYFDLLTGTLTS